MWWLSMALAAAAEAPISVEAWLADGSPLVAWVEAQDPDVQGAAAEVSAAQADRSAGRGLPDLEIDVGASASPPPRNPVDLPSRDTVNIDLDVGWNLDLATRKPRLQALGRSEDAASARQEDRVTQRLAQIRELLIAVMSGAARMALMQEREQDAQALLRQIRARYDAGDVSGTDRARMEVEVSRDTREVDAAKSDYLAAQAACEARLQRPCVSEFATRSWSIVQGMIPSDVSQAPAIQALTAQADAARWTSRESAMQAVPDPQLHLRYTRDYLVFAGDQAHTIGAGVSFRLPVSRKSALQASADLARASAIEAERTDMVARLLAQSEQLAIRESSLQARLQSIDTEAMPATDRMLEGLKKAWATGEASLTELLLARRDQTDLLLERLEVERDLLLNRAARAEVAGVRFWGVQ